MSIEWKRQPPRSVNMQSFWPWVHSEMDLEKTQRLPKGQCFGNHRVIETHRRLKWQVSAIYEWRPRREGEFIKTLSKKLGGHRFHWEEGEEEEKSRFVIDKEVPLWSLRCLSISYPIWVAYFRTSCAIVHSGFIHQVLGTTEMYFLPFFSCNTCFHSGVIRCLGGYPKIYI